jgi:hypothetical protein
LEFTPVLELNYIKILKERVMTPRFIAGSVLEKCLARVEKYYARGWAFEGNAPACSHCEHDKGEKVRLALEMAKELTRNLVRAANTPTSADGSATAAGAAGGGSCSSV